MFVNVTVAPLFTKFNVCPPIVAVPEVDVAEATFRTNKAEVAPPHEPVRGTVAETRVPT